MPRPLDMKSLAAMEAATPKLWQKRIPQFTSRIFFFATWSPQHRDRERSNALDRGRQIGIIDRPEEDFFPKGCEGWVPIASDVLAEILRFQPLCADGYLVPGRTETERHRRRYRRHSKWVSQWIKDKAKTSYELRRYAGSRLLDMGATIFEVRDFLRHRDVQTTQMWYAYRLQNRQLRTIGMSDLLPG